MDGEWVVGEFALIAAIRAYLDGDGPGLPLGVDDDAAVLDLDGVRIAVAVDTLVDGVHVDRSISSFADLGWKALAVNVSDVVAVGAAPVAAVVSLQRPDDVRRADVEELYRGMREAADRWGVSLVGGDTVDSPTLAVSVTILGRPLLPDVLLRRDGARPGDAVVVIGDLGAAAAGLAGVRAGLGEVLDRHPGLLAAHRRPDPPVSATAAVLRAGARAGIDVSDGLGRDLAHVARGSGVAIRLAGERLGVTDGVRAVAEALGQDPVELVLGGGDDYALAVTLDPDAAVALAAELTAAGTPAAVVGEVVPGTGEVVVLTADGAERDVSGLGWEHGG